MIPVAGVVGTRGIGAVHVREYLRAGVGRVLVAGRTADSGRAQAAALSERFGKRVEAVGDLQQLVDSDVRDVSLCTPTENHFEHLLVLARAGKRVFCEKPLLWSPGLSRRTLDERLARLEAIAAPGQIRLNTPNSWFLEAALDRFGLPHRPAAFRFEFFTQGRAQGAMIGVDLLPHALSLLAVLDPDAEIAGSEIRHDANSFHCSFRYGSIAAELAFAQAERGERRLAFELDGMRVERVPYMVEGAYRVALRAGGRQVDVEDPFAVAIRAFLDGGASPQALDLPAAARLTRQMGSIMLGDF